jgi:hypothetical protein
MQLNAMMRAISGGGAPTLRAQFALSQGRSMPGVSSSGYLTGGFTRYNCRRRSRVNQGSLVNPVLFFPSFTVKSTGYVAAPNSFTISCAIEVGGTSTQVTFNGGSTTQVISSAQNWWASDPVAGLTIPSGTSIFFRTEVITALTTDLIPALEQDDVTHAVEQVVMGGTNSQILATGAMTAAASGGGTVSGSGAGNLYPYGPLFAAGAQPAASSKSVMAVGMSIIDGVVTSFDTTTDAGGNAGWFAKGCYAAGVPFTKLTRGSNQMRWSVPSFAGDAYTLPMTRHSHVLLDNFTNDLATGGRTLAQLQADALTMITAARSAGAKVIMVKILPRTNGSNVPVTGFAPGGIRDQFNAWLGTKLADATIDYLIDFNPLMESGSTGTWANFATDTYEGIHPKPVMYTSMAAQFQTFLGTL